MFGEFIGDCGIKSVAVFFVSLLLSFFFAPVLWSHSTKRGFTAKPNHRSSHDHFVPNTGGILLFFSITIPLLLFSDIRVTSNFIFIVIAFISLFVVGFLDDLRNVSVKVKLLGQFIPAIFLILSLYHHNLVVPYFISSTEWPELLKVAIWVIAIVGIINAYNFIDGIDGLAIGLGFVGGVLFGFFFYAKGYCNLSILSFSFTGGLAGLLKQNISREKKIFIGDTGSLIIGGILSFFILRLLEISPNEDLNFSSSMVFGILFIPLSDLIRIVFIRMFNGKSPFSADRNHVHHIIMDAYSLSHRRTSAILISLQCIIFLVFLLFNEIFQRGQILLSVGLLFVYVAVLQHISKKRI